MPHVNKVIMLGKNYFTSLFHGRWVIQTCTFQVTNYFLGAGKVEQVVELSENHEFRKVKLHIHVVVDSLAEPWQVPLSNWNVVLLTVVSQVGDSIKIVSFQAFLEEILKILGQDWVWSNTIMVKFTNHAIGQVVLIADQRVLKHTGSSVWIHFPVFLLHIFEQKLILQNKFARFHRIWS